MKKLSESYRVFSMCFPSSLHEKVKREAVERKCSMASLIRKAIEHYLSHVSIHQKAKNVKAKEGKDARST